MIFGNLRAWNTEKAFFPPAFARALAFLDEAAAGSLSPGRYDIEGDAIFAQVTDAVTEAPHLRRFELHREYIDIHYLVTGAERQLYAPEPESGHGLLEDALAARDVAFYSHPADYNSVILKPGDYAAYLPGELHCPCCAMEEGGRIRKIIFKLRANTIARQIR